MTKIVLNRTYGGFELSDEAVNLYNKKVSAPEKTSEDLKKFQTNKLVWSKEHNEYIYSSDLYRDDPVLVEVVEELGDKANAKYSKLKIKECENYEYAIIKEYDGKEWTEISFYDAKYALLKLLENNQVEKAIGLLKSL